ncbi:methyltransferase domain-containing protein [Modestobacter versicolor]|uniref:2-polyprenyl-3-methyl-5-hydroxy-6-metoxy-1, 4-benzoquinol methylase n=1 Tax=Modestobacter versicolor TaxID=429133 RepID=A0A323V7R1_9ACTN|nr:methyltransferase domain-containing protein [Modestobacter versicolor]MBB3675636.1 2-polyprenyl-3-methyl-5-hydroxy-6-metoxy-1,4-benzoquinol methylase [Modestobacter versicolor]PZA20927.1 methyltransferase type 11 [Modestobacter versicolor]
MTTPPATAAQAPARTAAIWAALDPVVSAGPPLQVLDVGGGSGMFAVPLAQLGHQVTVVDPSADALATLHRRAATAGAGERVRGVQGDGDRMLDALPSSEPYDLVLCHYVLEVVDDPASTLQQIAGVLRPGGRLSAASANRAGAVLARAIGGHPVEARALVTGQDPAPARGGPARRRFSPDELLALIAGAGLEPGEWRGVSVVTDLLGASTGADSDALRALELSLAGTSPYRDVATALHVLATRPGA